LVYAIACIFLISVFKEWIVGEFDSVDGAAGKVRIGGDG
jgi:hypothetical protein